MNQKEIDTLIELLKEEVIMVDKKYIGNIQIDKGSIVSENWIVNRLNKRLEETQ